MSNLQLYMITQQVIVISRFISFFNKEIPSSVIQQFAISTTSQFYKNTYFIGMVSTAQSNAVVPESYHAI